MTERTVGLVHDQKSGPLQENQNLRRCGGLILPASNTMYVRVRRMPKASQVDARLNSADLPSRVEYSRMPEGELLSANPGVKAELLHGRLQVFLSNQRRHSRLGGAVHRSSQHHFSR